MRRGEKEGGERSRLRRQGKEKDKDLKTGLKRMVTKMREEQEEKNCLERMGM
jgi:hypothetical protein